MKLSRTVLLLAITLGIFVSSCRIFNPSVMLRSGKDYPYALAEDTLPSEYTFQKGDLLSFRLFSNQGFKIIDIGMMEGTASGVGEATNRLQNTILYRVESDSTINLPIIGRTQIAGLDLKDAELRLEEKYSNYYNDPFVVLSVSNRRCVVFPGAGGDARVIPLENENTTIIEALALVGGISNGGKAHRIKVIRGDLNNPEIFKMDLSTTEGLAEANLYYVRANDIIYVEPSYFVGREVLGTTVQILTLVTSGLIAYSLTRTITN